MPAFARTIGIDYSGAETPTASLKGLRVYLAEGDAPPVEVPPPPIAAQILDPQGHRRMAGGTAGRGCAHAGRHRPRLFVPAALFRGASADARLAALPRRFPAPLADRRGSHLCRFRPRRHCGNGAARMGNARWRRLTEERAGGAKSVFHFDVQGSVAKSTHAGIPWLRFIRQRLGARVHFWPFDGWDIPAGRSAIAEVYPALWSRGFANEGRTGDQHDAFSIAAWLSRADRDGSLAAFLNPDLSPSERTLAQVEGWILGVTTRSVGRRSDEAPRVAPPTVASLSAQAETAGSRIEKACPECGHEFRGGTWGGIDAHWKAFHSDIMPYEDAWTINQGGRETFRRVG